MKQSYPTIFNDKSFVWDTCDHAIQRKLHFPDSDSYASNSFNLIQVNIWGPCANLSMHGHRYFFTIVNDHTRYVWVFLMKTKAETQSLLKMFTTQVEK